jgi:dTMP kinase
MVGVFIVLEGADGSGKSTQVARLAKCLRSSGREVVATFEPGATPVGAAVRNVLLERDEHVAPIAEALLMAADRAQHVAEIVRPALARGADVVSDRYVPSSLAYQGGGRGLSLELVDAINRWATGGLTPDLVIVIDISERVARTRRDAAPDRFERESADFHARVRDAYRKLAAEREWAVIDGDADVDTVAARVSAVVSERLGIDAS